MKGRQILIGLGLGAGLMYMLDPNRGKRRRAQVRDKVVHTLNVAGTTIGKASRDLNNRLAGLEAEVKSLFRSEHVDDNVLIVTLTVSEASGRVRRRHRCHPLP